MERRGVKTAENAATTGEKTALHCRFLAPGPGKGRNWLLERSQSGPATQVPTSSWPPTLLQVLGEAAVVEGHADRANP
jgi:hypothetical protein